MRAGVLPGRIIHCSGADFSAEQRLRFGKKPISIKQQAETIASSLSPQVGGANGRQQQGANARSMPSHTVVDTNKSENKNVYNIVYD